MKVIGTSDSGVIVELSTAEWDAIGGRTQVSGYIRRCDTSVTPDIRQTAEALRAIKNAKPDLKHMRSVMQTFLLLTDPVEVQEVLDTCGIAEPCVEADPDAEVDE